MPKKIVWLALLTTLLGNVGCCRWCDHWCGQQRVGGYAPAPAPVYAAPAYGQCQPVQCCPVPAQAPACCPTPAGSSPAGWARQPGCP